MLDSRPLLIESNFPHLQREQLQSLQVNLGYLCNQSCTHCHVNAGPTRKELMDRATIDVILEVLEKQQISLLDITGGAPEMNPHFRYLVIAARKLGVTVIDRCNLTILLEKGNEDLADFLAQQQVLITASLPCYEEKNVNEQRGKGVYNSSIEALRRLNELGYGEPTSELTLNLVYNPNGAFLPPAQQPLQQAYKEQLKQRFGIVFNELYVITNMPISRFGSMLISKGRFKEYMDILKNAYQAENLKQVMCRTLVSVDYQGFIYDCDFNQMLKIPLIASDKPHMHISDLLSHRLTGNKIAIGEHCYGCTAGQGSSCGGALEE